MENEPITWSVIPLCGEDSEQCQRPGCQLGSMWTINLRHRGLRTGDPHTEHHIPVCNSCVDRAVEDVKRHVQAAPFFFAGLDRLNAALDAIQKRRDKK